MKDEQKKLHFIRKTIFSYVEEMYQNDKFLIQMVKNYNELNNKLIPVLDNAERIKEIMKNSDCLSKKVTEDCQPSDTFKEKFEKIKDVVKDQVSDDTNVIYTMEELVERINNPTQIVDNVKVFTSPKMGEELVSFIGNVDIPIEIEEKSIDDISSETPAE